MEKIKPFVRSLWWTPTFQLHLDKNKKEAKQQYDNAICDPSTIYIYMDGSGIDKQIGAAAYCPSLGKT
jgi:hypothetical protein